MNEVQQDIISETNPVHQIRICRICLAPEKYAKLHDIHNLPLARFLEEITGCTVGRSDGLPPFVCLFCSRLLHRFNGFRQQCLSSSDLLHDAAKCNLMYLNLANSKDSKYEPLLTRAPIQVTAINETDDETTQTCDELPMEPISDLFDDDASKEEIKVSKINSNKDLDDDVDNANKNDVKKEYEAIGDEVDVNNDVLALTNEVCIKNEETIKNENVESHRNEVLYIDEEMSDDDSEPLVIDEEAEIKRKPKTCFTKELDEVSTRKPIFKPGSKEWNVDFCKQYNFIQTVLSKEEQIKEVQDRKESRNYKESPYKCGICYKGFMVPSTYENHIIVYHSPNDPYVCEICGFRFKNKHKYNVHVRGRHLNSFKCKQCGATFKLAHAARYHYDWHNGNKCICEHCGKEFRTQSTKQNHVRREHASVQCTTCKERFVSHLGLQWHLRLAHKEALCTSCKIHFYSAAALKTHETGHCDPTLRPCVQCGEGFMSEDSLKEHYALVHEHTRYDCELCKKTFPNLIKLANHMRWTHSKKTRRSNKQEQDKKNNKKWMCEICGKDNFVSRAFLSYHQRSHTGERPYKCTICGKTFTILQTLKIHMTVHTDERRYKCLLCPKGFRQQHHLQAHMVTHTKERPYACSLCPKTYTGSTSLKEHIDVAHRGLPARKWKKKPDKYTGE